MVGGRADLFERQGLGPDTRLEHVAVIGATELEVCTSVLCFQSLFGGAQDVVCYFNRPHIEARFAGLLRDAHDAREGHDRIQHFGGFGEEVLTVRLDEPQAVIFGQDQLFGHLSVAGLEEDHVVGAVGGYGRFDHHVNREVRLRQVPFGFGGG